MSEPTTYYREAPTGLAYLEGDMEAEQRWVVPVVPCKHGSTQGHYWLTCSFHDALWRKSEDMCLDAWSRGDEADWDCSLCVEWCPGAGNGDNDNAPIGTVTATDGYSPLAHGPMKWCALTVEEHLPMMARYRLIRIDEGAGIGDNDHE